ncbi:hypothetical protein EDD17DRAFT_1546695 [Pisolithus thermaeus]|nr:hypothetical protein EV401DRAFT_1903460 [Pisolithus croceorrhizus]KAI6166286.1 hypothetical protein EDD17DRAFT_1546695 [Pisolithus thermaeus]
MQREVCQYYLRGICKFGDRCKNEHPRATTKPPFGNQSWSANTSKALLFTTETLTNDVTPLKEKPLWPLSSYGTAKHEKTLISGLDESPEELRVRAVAAVKAGTINDYMKYEAEKIVAADQIYANARDNIPQLHSRASELSHNLPSSIFGSPSASGGSAFGALSSQPSIGAKPGASAFGQPTFGQSGFGTVSAGTSAFGQTAQTSSAFSTTQPTSLFGQPSQMQSAFSQPTSAFSQTSAFGQAPRSTTTFGQPSQATSVFGQAPKSTFGQTISAFDQAQSTPTFAQSSLIKPGSGAFGSTTTGPSPFGTSSGGGGFSAFSAQPSGFAAAATSSPATPATGSMFGQATFPAAVTTQSAQPQSAFAPAASLQSTFTPSSTSAFGNAPSTLPDPSPMSAFPAAGLMAPSPTTSGMSKPSSGPPDFALAKSRVHCKPETDRFAALLPPNYLDIIPPDVRAAFESDKFEWGKIPEWIPPKEVR